MRTKVTEQGVVLPKQWFEGVDEVEIRRESDCVIVAPAKGRDSLLNLGKHPIRADVNDASVNVDSYLYPG